MANLIPTNQPAKYRSLTDLRMLEPDLEPLHGLAGEIGNPALPFRIGLSPADQYLAGAVRPEFYVANLKCHQFPAPCEGFIGDTKQRALAIGADSLTGAADKFLDLLPAQGTRLRLPSGGLAPHLLQRQPHRFTRTGIQQPGANVRTPDGGDVPSHRRRLLAAIHLMLDESAD